MKSVDILVPSFRLDPAPLLEILDLEVPEGTTARWIIVSDNPYASLDPAVEGRIDGDRVCVVPNSHAPGSAGARNTALDASSAEWVLFLDDDVHPAADLLRVYAEAVRAFPDSPGFFGTTEFEPGRTSFQRGVEASDILTFFRVATWYSTLPWAPTSNVLVRGEAARSERFRSVFPRAGGGEDIDYFLRVCNQFGSPLVASPEARVHHPWWYSGARSYRRFMRWSYGDSLLHEMHPQHTYRAAPNAIELLALMLPISLCIGLWIGSVLPIVVAVLGVLTGEVVVEFFRLLRLKGFRAALYCVETVLIRSSNDVGRFAMLVWRLRRWRGITERWDHFCDGLHVGYHRKWAMRKHVAHLSCMAAFLWLLGLLPGST